MLVLILVLNEVFGFYKPNKGVKIIEIARGTSLAQISKILKSEGIVNSRVLFDIYARFSGFGSKLKYGAFNLNSSMSYFKIVQILTDESKNETGSVQLNVFEGSNMFNLQKKYCDEKSFDVVEFVEKLNNENIYGKFDFVKKLKLDQLKQAYYPMEGFCAVDSFNVREGYGSETAARLVLSEFDKVITTLSDELESDIEKSGFNLWQLITLASVIQAEVSNVEDMAKVSSVLHNRLKKRRQGLSFKRLECDSTRKYAENIQQSMEKKFGKVDSKKVDSYNTYKCTGLPAGPICNPGVKAIEAAVRPAKTDYFYFCVDLKDGKAFFARTFEEHRENLKKAHLI